MTRTLSIVGSLTLCGLLGACAGGGGGSGTSAGADTCEAIARLATDAKRDAFSLDYAAAERGFRQINALYNLPGVEETCSVAFTRAQGHMNLALVLSNQRHYRLADGAFQAATATLSGRTDPDALADRAQLSVYQSHHSLNRNVPADARIFAEEALTLLDQVKGGDTLDFADNELFALDETAQNARVNEAQTLYALGFADLSDDRVEGVEERNIKALDLIKSVPATRNGVRSRFLIQRALTQSAKSNWREAAATANLAAIELSEKLPNSPLHARALLVEASALSFTPSRREALTKFEEAFAIYEETPVSLRYESIWPFIRFVNESVRRGEMTPSQQGALIFRAGQLVRGSFTAYDIASAAALFEAGDGAEAAAVRDWREAEGRLARLRSAQTQAARLLPEQVVELERQLAEAAQEEDRLRQRRDEQAPNYAVALNAPVGLTQIQSTLRPGELMVQILTGDPRSTVLLIGPDSIDVQTTGIDTQLLKRVVNSLRQSFVLQANNRYLPFGVELSFLLQNQIFGEFIDKVRAADHLFIATNDILQSMPLEILVTEDPSALREAWTAGDYRGLNWLGDDVKLSYLPSARNLIDIRNRAGQSRAEKPMIAFGDFTSNVGTETILANANLPQECAPEASLVANLAPLPGTAAEVERISAALGAGVETITNAAFTEDEVIGRGESGDLSQYQILHFATHGLLWQTEDCFTEPALVTSNTPGSGSDGLLTSSEIRQLDLDAQFVVLSACDTAGTGGDLGISGQSLSGLARAFFSSGSRAVVASHWLVDDQVAVELMGRTYEMVGPAEGEAFGTALKRAREEIREDPARSHPVFWAPFVVIGDGTLGLRQEGANPA